MHSIQNPFENLLKFVHASNFHTLDRTDMSGHPLKGKNFKVIWLTMSGQKFLNDLYNKR